MEYSHGSLEVVFFAYPQLSLLIILQNRQDAIFPKSFLCVLMVGKNRPPRCSVSWLDLNITKTITEEFTLLKYV
jgi:hypothetical protein